jgi:RNA polymerase sigma factor (sigma-70 family)
MSLAARMQAGEESAFSEFADSYGKRFRGYYLRQGLFVTDAEELAVSTVTDVALKIDRFTNQGPGSFDRWAFTLAYRGYVNWLREQSRQARAQEIAVSILRHPQNENAESRIRECVCSALSRLSQIDRDVLTMRALAVPFSFAEIGSALGLSQGAVRVRYHRARAKVRKLLEAIPEFRKWLGAAQ